MKSKSLAPSSIEVDLFMRKECPFSCRVMDELKTICDSIPDIKLSIKDISKNGGITPSVWVNGDLWFQGSFNPERFQQKIASM